MMSVTNFPMPKHSYSALDCGRLRGQLKLKSAESEFGCNLAGELSVSWLTIASHLYIHAAHGHVIFLTLSALGSLASQILFVQKLLRARGAWPQKRERVFVFHLSARCWKTLLACLSPGRPLVCNLLLIHSVWKIKHREKIKCHGELMLEVFFSLCISVLWAGNSKAAFSLARCIIIQIFDSRV